MHNRFASMPVMLAPNKEPITPIILSTGQQLHKRGNYSKTILSYSDVDKIIVYYLEGVSINQIATRMRLPFRRIKNIISSPNVADRIEKYRNELTIEREKQFRHIIIEKRDEIATKITPEDIRKANLGMKTGSLDDLTKINALEAGRSTENIAINLVTASKDDLLAFVAQKDDTQDDNKVANEVIDKSEIIGK